METAESFGRYGINPKPEIEGKNSYFCSCFLFVDSLKLKVMLSQYIQAAMRQAKYEILSDDGSFYAEIPGFQGVYANAETLEDCRNELAEALEE